MGNAPTSFGINVFTATNASFTIHYKAGATGWSNPYNGYPAVQD
jgi:hypothetical protein